MDTEQLSSIACRHPHLRLGIVFGSMAAGREGFDSDIDFAVLSEAPLTPGQHIALVDEIAGLTGRPVDLVDLSRTGEPLLGQILRHGRKLFGSDQDMAGLMQRHVYANEDFVPYVQRMLKHRNRRWLHS